MPGRNLIISIIGICFVLISTNSVSQDKKIITNVGLYYSPVIHYKVNSDSELGHAFAGSLFGLGTDLKIGNRSAVMIRLDMGRLSYNYSEYDYGYGLWGFRTSKYITNKISFSGDYRFNIIHKRQSFGLLYLSAGFITNIHFNEKMYYLFSDHVYQTNNPRFFNILTTLRIGYERNVTKNISLSLESYLGIKIWKNPQTTRDIGYIQLTSEGGEIGYKLGIKYTW